MCLLGSVCWIFESYRPDFIGIMVFYQVNSRCKHGYCLGGRGEGQMVKSSALPVPSFLVVGCLRCLVRHTSALWGVRSSGQGAVGLFPSETCFRMAKLRMRLQRTFDTAFLWQLTVVDTPRDPLPIKLYSASFPVSGEAETIWTALKIWRDGWECHRVMFHDLSKHVRKCPSFYESHKWITSHCSSTFNVSSEVIVA